MRGLADELASAKYSHIERERRWLVDPSARPSIDALPYELIEDRYIRGTRCRLRRMSASDRSGSSCKLSKKYDVGDALARPMVTFYLDEDEYSLFASLPADPLTKRRYSIDLAGQNWSLDVFGGPLEPLEMLEIEASAHDELQALRPPAWATGEVTHDERYQGGTLARLGLPMEI